MKTKIVVRKNRINASGESPLYLKATSKGKVKLLSLNIWVKPHLFNEKTERIRSSSADLRYANKNKKLSFFQSKAQKSSV